MTRWQKPPTPEGRRAVDHSGTNAGFGRDNAYSGFLDLSEHEERASRESVNDDEIRLFDEDTERERSDPEIDPAETRRPKTSKRLLVAAIVLFGITLGVIGLIVYFVLTDPGNTNGSKEMNGKANTYIPISRQTDYPFETYPPSMPPSSSSPGMTLSSDETETPIGYSTETAPEQDTTDSAAPTHTPDVLPSAAQTDTPTPKPALTPEPTVVPPPEDAQTFYSDGYNAVCVHYGGCNVRRYWSSKKSDSKVVGTLECGDQVAVLANYANWTLIRFVDDKGKEVYGWVFEQYLYDAWMKENHSVNDSLNNSSLKIPPVGEELFPTGKKTVKKTAVEMYNSPGAVDENGNRKSSYFTIPKSNEGRHVVSIYSEKYSYEDENGATVVEMWAFCVYSWDDSSGRTESRFGWVRSDLLTSK